MSLNFATTNNVTELMAAAARGNIDDISALLEAYPTAEEKLRALNLIDNEGDTALTLAVAKNKSESIQALMNACPPEYRVAMLNFTPIHNVTALMVAANNGNTDGIALLLEAYPTAEEKLRALNLIDNEGDTALTLAVAKNKPESMQALMNACPPEYRVAMLNFTPIHNVTALMVAANNGNTDGIALLLEAYPTAEEKLRALNLIDNEGDTALALAVAKNKPESIQALMNACPQEYRVAMLNFTPFNKVTALMVAAAMGNADSITLLLEAYPTAEEKLRALNLTNDQYDTALALAVAKNKPESIQALMNACPQEYRVAMLNFTPIHNVTALMVAAAVGNADSITLLLEAYPTAEEKLRALNLIDNEGDTALMLAAINDKPENIRALLTFVPEEQQPAFFAVGNQGKRALELAVGVGNVDMVHLLESYGLTASVIEKLKLKLLAQLNEELGEFVAGGFIKADAITATVERVLTQLPRRAAENIAQTLEAFNAANTPVNSSSSSSSSSSNSASPPLLWMASPAGRNNKSANPGSASALTQKHRRH